ncbi:MAG TPA: hypothetical protein VG406_12635 [Isosphaeraceae bacterium]|jgi:hypothetical protein|nr:hypothetical protein [Isosphaeraceae bacterium]
MNLATIAAIVLALAASAPSQTTPRRKARPEPPRPLAMVLAVKGAVRVTPPGEKARKVAVEDLLYADDAIAVPADGSATIAILGAGLRQTLKGGGTVKLGPKGCGPSPTVESKALPRAVAGTMKGVQPAVGDARKAGVAPRGAPPEPSPPLAPIAGALVDSLRPELAWRAQKGVPSYRVTVSSAAGEALWKAETTAPKLAPSQDRPELNRGEFYTWKVTDPAGREVTSGHFTVADAEESKQLAELKPLASSQDPADLLAAALTYDRLGCFAEALSCYESLVTLCPDVPSYRASLDRLRQMTAPPAAPK